MYVCENRKEGKGGSTPFRSYENPVYSRADGRRGQLETHLWRVLGNVGPNVTDVFQSIDELPVKDRIVMGWR